MRNPFATDDQDDIAVALDGQLHRASDRAEFLDTPDDQQNLARFFDDQAVERKLQRPGRKS